MKRRIALFAALLTCVWIATASAQLGDALKKIKRAAEDAASKSGAAKSSKPADSETTKETTSTTTTTTTTTTTKSDVNGQPNLSAMTIDFVPGERTVFYDDFSDMAPDEPPPHWRLRSGKVDLKMGNGVRELAPSGDGVNLTSPSITVPSNFTFEASTTGTGEIDWIFRDKEDHDVLTADTGWTGDTKAWVRIWGGEDLGEGDVEANVNEPLHLAVWAQQGRVRAYLNGKRLIDVNQVTLKPIDHIIVHPSRYRPNGIRMVRVAESAPDFSKSFASTGKYVTHGIHFATDSDRIEPDSAAVIRMIANELEKNPTLKLEVVGYTDSVGDANHNLDLSKRRAQAVESVLVSQFNIPASRLSAAGFGADKPIASNDTAEGRAANRRVEFVRQ